MSARRHNTALRPKEYERNKQLVDAKIVTESEFSTIEANSAVAKSNVRSAQINLDKARQNLAYTSILAPIDGVIVSRTVDVGQTVAASLSTPELFRLAEDLTDMQILASVDESDIGRIEVGQPVSFTVAAYQGRTFSGSVEQVRLQSATTENVVNYTVVVAVSNEDRKLLPGMTSTLKFQTNSAQDVVAVPNSALRFTPTAEMLEATGATIGSDSVQVQQVGVSNAGGATGGSATNRDNAAAATGNASGARGGSRRDGSGNGNARAAVATVWTVNSSGTLTAHRVSTGLNDGQKTEIKSAVSGSSLEPGMQVVIGTSSGTSTNAASSNPFQQTQQGGRGPGRF